MFSEPDHGIYDALNKGIARSTGDVVGFLHADDLYYQDDSLLHIAQAFTDSSVCAVYGDLEYVQKNDTKKIVRRWKSATFKRKNLDWGWMPPHPTLYVRRDWYARTEGFDTRYKISADYFSILKLFSMDSFKSVYIPEILIKMRLGGTSNRSLKNILHKSTEDLDALRRSGIGGVMALFCKNLRKLKQFL